MKSEEQETNPSADISTCSKHSQQSLDGVNTSKASNSTSTFTSKKKTMTTPATNASACAPPRALACVQCQQRKVKCDRTFPCAGCVRMKLQCVPALAPRPRRKRFPERQLLDRIRHYEALLRQHAIPFEPLHSNADDGAAHALPQGADQQTQATSPRDADTPRALDFVSSIKAEPNLDDATPEGSSKQSPGDGSDDDDQEARSAGMLISAWDQTYHDAMNDQFLFGSSVPAQSVALSTLHPAHVNIFRLWQIYFDNVQPLMRCTHAPSLQVRVLDAAVHLDTITPQMEAILFSVYCVSILTISENDCRAMFSAEKAPLLSGYQFACRQALLKCDVLRSADRECLTALFLYLVSVGQNTHPAALSCMLAVALHKAQQLGLHMESTYSKYTALEAETCRRLWWAMVTFSHRMCELSEYRTTPLSPVWDCKLPSNLYESELRDDTTTLPQIHDQPTESLFVLLRSRQADFLRRSDFHLSFVNPDLSKITSEESNDALDDLEQELEQKYLVHSDPANPIHFMTVWTSRGSLARMRLLHYYARNASADKQPQPPPQLNAAQRDSALGFALRMLECDTFLLSTSLVRGYTWFVNMHFPMLAYVHVLRHLRKWPDGSNRAWQVLSENYDAHAQESKSADAVIAVCFRLVAQAWRAHESVPGIPMPRIVLRVRERAAEMGLQLPPALQQRQPDFDATGLLMPQITQQRGPTTQAEATAGWESAGLFSQTSPSALSTAGPSLWEPFDWDTMTFQ